MHATGQFLINLLYFKPLQNRVTDGNDPVLGCEKKMFTSIAPAWLIRSEYRTTTQVRGEAFTGAVSVYLDLSQQY